MSWLDILALFVIIGVSFLESHRGFGLALFDAVGALIAVKVSISVTPKLAESMRVGSSTNSAEAFWFLLSFIVLAGLMLLASKLLYQTTLLSLDTMDPIVGAILGFASGIIVSYVLLATMMLAYQGQPFADVLSNTAAYQQLVDFKGYNYLMDICRHIGE